jgi:hypothetical protein
MARPAVQQRRCVSLGSASGTTAQVCLAWLGQLYNSAGVSRMARPAVQQRRCVSLGSASGTTAQVCLAWLGHDSARPLSAVRTQSSLTFLTRAATALLASTCCPLGAARPPALRPVRTSLKDACPPAAEGEAEGGDGEGAPTLTDAASDGNDERKFRSEA